ncbi:pleckstrin homology domain-containing family G member 1 isoform X1 [Bufo bufo]|uniref:pleckstrin homology domain-containing family G member 1 isoform X1 n=2 Tax=Bufo bufo TaxID=8384 RepID=UPI001ABE002A|nr:pleckstrin homology domain-containing family G member 1 isoform X1 [Bufo bufo]
MPDKTPEGTETTSQNEDDYHLPLDSLTSVTEHPSPRTTGVDLNRTNRHLRYCGIKNMELSDSDRPVSFGSTSSSASSRDSRCSFGSRMTLASNSHMGLFHQDKEAGAIKLDLVPSRQLSNDELRTNYIREPGHGSPREKYSDERRTIPWKESKGSVKNCSKAEVVEPTSPKLMYVDRVVQEILQTERTYVQDLKSIVEDYLNCISDQTRLSLGAEERSALFGNIRDIYNFNSELLQELENCDNDPVAIAECFVSKSEEFHIYTQYCTNYPRSVAVLTECMRNKILAKFFRERQEVLQHSLPLGSYLLKPVQRILKYHLLLHEISNHLDKDTEGYDVVLDAIDTMQRVAWHINDMKRKHEHDIRLQEIQSLLTNWKGPDLTSYGELVLEGTFRFQRAKNERTLFLFDRLLLITKKRDDSYTYKAHILCCNLMLVEVIPKEPLSFSVFHYKNPKLQHTVQAKSLQDKRLWILHLKRLILENHPAKIPAKAKQAILEMDAIHHPGFSYTTDGEKKTTPNVKEEPTPGRVRRKSEPLSNVHKVMKPNDMSLDVQKRISMQGNLLCQAAKLGSRDMLLSPGMRKAVLSHSTDICNSPDFFHHTYKNEKLHLGPGEQTDADDEEDSDLHGSHHKVKGGRKRLNSQAAENVEKRRSINLSLCDSQNSKDQSDEESSQSSTLFSSSAVHPLDRQQSVSQTSSLIMNILGNTTALRNIWTDHQIRQALFPSRRSPHDNEDDDDDYQMFMMNECSRLESSRSQEERGASSRPCSWHLGLMQEDTVNNSYCKIVRRASSVGENKTRSCNLRSRQTNSSHQFSHCDILNKSDQKFSSLGSSEELTNDDIEHVYDNISYDDLKLMGLTRREETDYLHNPRRDTDHQSKINTDVWTVKGHEKANSTSVPNRDKAMYRKGTPNSSSQELRIIEENIYDSICIPEQSLEHITRKSHSKRNNFLGLDGDFQCFDQLENFVSEESLQFSEDESMDHRVPLGDNYNHLLNNSSNSSSVPHKTTADKLSEEVDEIWNDLENYIKKNEEKKSDRSLASFPVSKDDVREKKHTVNRSHFSKGSQFSISSLCLPDNSTLPRTTVSNSPNVRKKDPSPSTSPTTSLLSLKRTSLTGEMTFIESPFFSSQSTLSYTDSMNAAQGLDSIEKSKNKVFLMARQYSQKIKKANQLLKIKSPEQEQQSSKSHKLKSKDLAAIMEEKKQGGAAIGARIAEYSQLYDQIIFRESPARTSKESKTSRKDSLALRTEHDHQQAHPGAPRSKACQQSNTSVNSVHINGDADFFTWPDIKDFKEKSDIPSNGQKGQQRNMISACSVPSLVKSSQSSLHNQRWSTISQEHDENASQGQAFHSLGRRIVNEKTQPYIRSQSSSSMLIHRTKEPIKPTKTSTSPQPLKPKRLSDIYDFGGSYIEENRHSEESSDMTLQDSQKILVLNKLSSLNAQIATLNYLANFKDTDGAGDGDDDEDDYVEIKSEDEDDELEVASNQPMKLHMRGHSELVQTPCSTSTPYSFSMPTTPVKSLDEKQTPDDIAGYDEVGKLNDYLWRAPPSNQQNIVQSLREKFQCLSSSSFA